MDRWVYNRDGGRGAYKGKFHKFSSRQYTHKTDYKRQFAVFELVLCFSKVSTHNTYLVLQWFDGVGEGTRKRGICSFSRLVQTSEFYNGGQISFG